MRMLADYCTKRGIKVVEQMKILMILKFSHIGYLALKMIFEAGYEVFNNNIIIWSNDNFGDEILKVFNSLKPKSLVKTIDYKYLKKSIKETDLIFICDYNETRNYFTKNFFNLDELLKINSDFGIVHLYGNIDYNKNCIK